MDHETMDTETEIATDAQPASQGEPVPTVIAKKRHVDAPPAGLGAGGKDERNAAEIARLSGWAKDECGAPILAD